MCETLIMASMPTIAFAGRQKAIEALGSRGKQRKQVQKRMNSLQDAWESAKERQEGPW